MNRWGAWKWYFAAIAAVAMALFLRFIWPESIWLAGLQWVLFGLLGAIAVFGLLCRFDVVSSDAERVQVVSALFTACAILVAAGLYFFERRNQPKLNVSLEASVIRPTANDKAVDFVLVAVRVLMKNTGHRAVRIKCNSLDLLSPNPGSAFRRSSPSSEEMHLAALSEKISYDTDLTSQCNRITEQRKDMPVGSIRPLFMWKEIKLEPGEEDDTHFEIPVSCRFPFVRVLSKIRLNPDDRLGYESKALVSLWDACQGETGHTPAVPTQGVETRPAETAP